MMRLIIFILAVPAVFCFSPACGQLVLGSASKDFGEFGAFDERFADFEITNTGTRDEIIFRVEVDKHTSVRMSAKTVAPGKTETVRLQYNPPQEGPFRTEAKIFASAWQSPRSVTLTGNALFAETGVPCPDFSEVPSGALRTFTLALRDAHHRPLSGVDVQFYKNGKRGPQLTADSRGELRTELQPGRWLIALRGKGIAADTAVYTSATLDRLLWVIKTEITPEEGPEPMPEEDRTAEIRPEMQPADSRSADTQPQAGDSEIMPLSRFKQSNVVFLVDVSTSMKQRGRMDLLKVAMIDLLEVLRDADRLSLITYASETHTLIRASEALDREACAAAISALQPGGSTAGAKAVDTAGKTARKHFLPEGNNQIILATDGAFNEGAKQARRLARKHLRKGVNLSVLCIRCGSFTEKEMRGLAEAGNGEFIAVDEIDDAGARLISEVKRSALR